MNKISRLSFFILLILYLPLSINPVNAADIKQIQKTGEEKLKQAEASQKRIDKIVESAQGRLIQYRSLQKQIEGLKTYNQQLNTQIENQKDLINRFDKSISQVSLIERQMIPLINKMVKSLKTFIEIDLPFNTAERQDRISYIEETMASSEIDLAEKFRLIMEAYQIENEYGRKLDHFEDIVLIDGTEYEVDVLRVGRIAMVSQSKDTLISARWNNETETWEPLENTEYRNAIRQGIKMAKKQAPIDIVSLPISAPKVMK